MGTGVSVGMSVSVGASSVGAGTSADASGSDTETEAGVDVGRMGAMFWGRNGGSCEGSMDGIGGNEERAGKFRGGREERGGTADPTAGGRLLLPANDTAPRSGSERLRLGNRGDKPAGRGIRPGSVAAEVKLVEVGLRGLRGFREDVVDEGSRGTVGKPVCSSLGMLGAAVLMDRPERESSRPVGIDTAVGGGVTADS